MCEAVLALDNGPDNCISWPNYGWFFEQSVAQQGALLANNDNGRSDRATEVFLTSDAMLAYVNWWKDIQDKGYYIYTGLQRDWDGVNNAFFAEQVALEDRHQQLRHDQHYRHWRGQRLRRQAGFMPHNQDVDYVGNLIGGASLWLTNGLDADTEEGALTWLLWFTNTENAADWHQFTGYIPIRTSSVQMLQDAGWYEPKPQLPRCDMPTSLPRRS